MLEVDNRVILPELTHVRFVITSADVIHSFTAPSLAIKCDAYPGRLNQVSVLINREGVFYGQLGRGEVPPFSLRMDQNCQSPKALRTKP